MKKDTCMKCWKLKNLTRHIYLGSGIEGRVIRMCKPCFTTYWKEYRKKGEK